MMTKDKINEIRKHIEESNGSFFSATNVKKNGEVRKYCCRTGVKKYLHGGELSYNPLEKDIVVVYDVNKKNYRAINLNTLTHLRIKGKQII